ncbi:MAG: hypothetical protein HDT35_01215 [Clostridiales bacterium]|nr:hypothetical protein [Clostridiales bacterium]
MEPGKPTDVFLDAKLFGFMLCALRELTEPLVGQDKFRITIESDPESKKVVAKYRFE